MRCVVLLVLCRADVANYLAVGAAVGEPDDPGVGQSTRWGGRSRGRPDYDKKEPRLEYGARSGEVLSRKSQHPVESYNIIARRRPFSTVR